MGGQPNDEQKPDDEPTRADTPESIAEEKQGPPSIHDGSTGASLGGSTSGTSVATPLETMALDEIGRTRIFLKFAMGIAVFTGVVTPWMGGDPGAKRVLFVGLLGVLVSCGWLAWTIRDDAGYTVPRVLFAAYPCIFASFCAIWFFGLWSPASVILPFGLYFFSSAQSARATLSVYLSCAVMYAALNAIVWLGVVPDVGIVRADDLHGLDRGAMLLMVEVTLTATYMVARKNREASLRALELHDRAVRGLVQREALLEEARADLAAALRAGGIGRFTEAVLGSFKIGKLIGRGAMGEVYEAVKTSDGSSAAVKLLQAHVLMDPDLVRRFMREAKIAQSLDVPNVVSVLEIGGSDSAFPYIAMERLRGEDLADHLRRHRRLSPSKVAQLLREVGRGLEAARTAGIVHRDLKPRNLFHAESEGIGSKRIWKILDFGVSKLTGGEGTQTRDQIVGTPSYMSPEQASGQPVGHKTDLYALGVIAYRSLTGRPAFTGDHTAETLYQVVYQMPPRPSEVAKVAPEIDLVIAIAMAKRESDRFDSGAEIADALESAARGKIAPELRARAEKLLLKHPWGTAGRASAERVA